MRLSCLVAAIVAIGSGLPVHAQAPAAAPPVYAVAYVEVLPSSAAAARTALKSYRDASRADDGYAALDLFERPDRAGHFVLIETWRDQKGFDAHGMAAHTTRLMSALAPIRVSGYDQRPYKALATAPQRQGGTGGATHVVTHVDTVPGPQSDGPGLLTRLAEASRKEPGNVRFDVLQHAMRANHFTIVETWANQGALDAHAGAAHTKQYRDSLQPFSGGPLDERIYKSVD
jgi:quinol monooxygenase YgiN